MTNLLVVVVDDMRLDHLELLPALEGRLRPAGTTFTEARCNVPLCQPSRVGFLQGQLSRDHGDVLVGFYGSAQRRDDQVAAWLAAAGYRCGMFGKYVNGLDGAGGIDPPPGWHTWRQSVGGATAEHFEVRTEAGVRSVAGVHQSDYFAGEAMAFVRAAPEPWFAYVATADAHHPFLPHPDLLDAGALTRCREVRVGASEGSAFTRAQPELTAADWTSVQGILRSRVAELAAADRAVGELVDLVDELGQAERTVVVVTSDNGVYQGEHRRWGRGAKSGPHDVALRVPLLAVGPGFPAGLEVDTPVYAHQDITATLVEVAGATPTLPAQAGTSLRTLAADPGAPADRALLHEIGEGYPSGDLVTTGPRHPLGAWKLVRSPSAREGLAAGAAHVVELYDLQADPDELHDLGASADHQATRAQLEALLDALLAGPPGR